MVVMEPICDALCTGKLTVLNIHLRSSISDDAFEAFLVALKASSALRELTVNDELMGLDCGSRRTAFTEYLEKNSVLHTLSVRGSRYGFLECVLTGMLNNRSVSRLNLFECSVYKGRTYELLRDIFAENTVLTGFSMVSVKECVDPPEELFDEWLEGLAKNSQIEYLRFPFAIVPYDGWDPFFETLSTHRSLDKVVVDVREQEYDALQEMPMDRLVEGLYDRLLDACKSLESSGAKHKVTFMFEEINPHDAYNMTSEFLEFPFCIPAATFPPMGVLKQLCSFGSCCMTELRVDLSLLEGQSSKVAEFVKQATTLQKMFVCESSRSDSVWSTIMEALAQNTSISEVEIYAKLEGVKNLERLAEALKRSKTIRKLIILSLRDSDPFPGHTGKLPVELSKNYSLCSFRLYGDAKSKLEWLAWYDTAWRNSGIVARAASFIKRSRCDRRCASALETVSRHPALMKELAEVHSLSDADVASSVRTRLRDIQGIHEFMRLAGVVKERVTCLPPEHGRKQLHDLNEYCWSHVRRYLRLEDVRYSATADETALE